jgi:two-component system chemotaxis sensor kinase CheA
LKGSAGAVGFHDLEEFTHNLESLLLRIKNRELEATSGIVSLLLRCNDYLRSVVETLRSNPEAQYANPDLLREVQAATQGEASLAAPSSPSPSRAASASPAPSPPETKEEKTRNPDESIRVQLGKIDSLLNNVGELVILQTVLSQQRAQIASPLLQRTIGQMAKIVKEIQETSMTLRMIPLKQAFLKMQRIVRDTSAALGKEIALELSGEETELDKTVLEQLGDPLVHLIRNAVDHGMEAPDERVSVGKSRTGAVRLAAYHRGGKVIIEVKDDGRGLDPQRLKAKAVEKGLIGPEAVLSDDDCYQLIFAAGFSTKTEVSEVSGRGVGMDVVKTNIQSLQGEIELETKLGQGTCFRIALPLTMAIVDSMVVLQGGERFVLPIAQVSESLQPRKEDVSMISERAEVLLLRGECIPLLRLSALMRNQAKEKRPAWECIAVIVRQPGQKPFSVLVDEIICQQQVVIKRLGDEINELPGISGAAILGDGKVGLILDLVELMSSVHSRAGAAQGLSAAPAITH